MKKIISVILAVMLVVMPGCIGYADDSGILDSILDKLAEYTPETRSGYIAYFRPFITTDAGVSAALLNIDSGAMDGIIQSIVGDSVDKAALRNIFLSFNCIDDDTELRIIYADILQKKIELDGADSSTLNGVRKLMNAVYKRSSSAEKIFTEDGITAGVVANVLTVIPKINGGEKLVKYKNGDFEINVVDQTFCDNFNAVWDGYTNESGKTVTYENLVYKFVNFLNDSIAESDKSSVAKALSNLDVCKYEASTASGGGSSSGGGGSSSGGSAGNKQDSVKPTENETENYTVLQTYDGITDEFTDGGFIIKTKETSSKVIEISTDAEAPMLYEFNDGQLKPVKYSVPSEKGLLAAVNPNSVYVVKSLSYPFGDAEGWGKSFIQTLYNRGIINGKSKTVFEPDDGITREEFVKLVVELFDLNDSSLKVYFDDVEEGAWYYSYVASAFYNNIVNGVGDNMFGTGQKIKRQDMAKIINTVLEENNIYGDEASSSVFKDYDTINDYAKEHVLAICGLGIISGDDNGNFNPNQFATRQEAAKMVCGMLTAYVNSLKE